jgi:hypothetical protein
VELELGLELQDPSVDRKPNSITIRPIFCPWTLSFLKVPSQLSQLDHGERRDLHAGIRNYRGSQESCDASTGDKGTNPSSETERATSR